MLLLLLLLHDFCDGLVSKSVSSIGRSSSFSTGSRSSFSSTFHPFPHVHSVPPFPAPHPPSPQPVSRSLSAQAPAAPAFQHHHNKACFASRDWWARRREDLNQEVMHSKCLRQGCFVFLLLLLLLSCFSFLLFLSFFFLHDIFKNRLAS